MWSWRLPPTPRTIGDHLDVELSQRLGIAHPGEHQQTRRVDGARRHHDLALDPQSVSYPVTVILDPYRALPFEADPGDEAAGQHRQIDTPGGGTKIRPRGVHSPSQVHRLVHGAYTFGLAGVGVGGLEVTHLLARLHEHSVQGMADRRHGHVQRSIAAAKRVRPAAEALQTFEVRQTVRERPVRQLVTGPALEVLRMTTGESHGVDRRGAAQHLAPGMVDHPLVEMRLGFRDQTPIEAGVIHRVSEGRGHGDANRVVGAARFQQQHRDIRVLAQPVRHHAAGRAGAHHHVIVGLLHILPPLTVEPYCVHHLKLAARSAYSRRRSTGGGLFGRIPRVGASRI